MKFPAYTIALSDNEVALCQAAAPLWGNVPDVVLGKNRLKKQDWTAILMSLESLASHQAHRQAAGRLASRIYAATHEATTDVIEEAVAMPVKSTKDRQLGLEL